MATNKNVRTVHRWTSLVFTLTVVICFVAVAMNPPGWVFYVPLPPLFLLLGTGLYLFASTHLGRRPRRS